MPSLASWSSLRPRGRQSRTARRLSITTKNGPAFPSSGRWSRRRLRAPCRIRTTSWSSSPWRPSISANCPARIVHRNTATQPHIHLIALAQIAPDDETEPNPFQSRKQPQRQQHRSVRRRTTGTVRARTDQLAKPFQIHTLHETPHNPRTVAFTSTIASTRRRQRVSGLDVVYFLRSYLVWMRRGGPSPRFTPFLRWMQATFDGDRGAVRARPH